MSTIDSNTTLTAGALAPAAHGSHHDPHLAHHFDTPQQQYATGKLGMWIFLATEILMFGGLFCAYGVYRHSHPEVFAFAEEHYLDRLLGTINTLVLIASSLSMAFAVRCAQTNNRRGLIVCLIITLIGAAGFMCIKGAEYHKKWDENVFVGFFNKYNAKTWQPKDLELEAFEQPTLAKVPPAPSAAVTAPRTAAEIAASGGIVLDPNAGGAAASNRPAPGAGPAGLADNLQTVEHNLAPPVVHSEMTRADLSKREQAEVNTFFSLYFLMTGLHGIHVLIGMGLITWLLIRSFKGHFSSKYFTPVDLVGLYWHLVDIIWIFLFPLLYLIRG